MKEELLQWETQGQPSASKTELQQRLSNVEKAQQEEAARAKTIESKNKELEEQMQSIKTENTKCLEAKEHLIQELQKQLKELQAEKQQYVEQVDELEEYVVAQETCYAIQLAERDKMIEEANNKVTQPQADWNTEKEDLQHQNEEIRKVAEQRRLDLYVAEAKLMQAEGGSQAIITDLQTQLAIAQFEASMTKEKV